MDHGLWLAVIGGMTPGATLAEQAEFGRSLLSSAIGAEEIRVVEALDLSGSFVVQTSLDVDQQTLTATMESVPGFSFVADFTPVEIQPNTDIPGPLTRSGYEALYGPFDYDAFVERELNGEVPDGSGPVEAEPADSLTNNNTGTTGTSLFTQSETTLVAFGNTVVVGFNDSGSTAGGANKFTGFAYSTDGGTTFIDGGTLPTSSVGDAGDPVMARNETTGRIYFATLQFSFSPVNGMAVFHSDDNGVTWSAPAQGAPGKAASGSFDQDKEWIAVDNFAGPGNGNVYLIERDFGAGNGIYFFRSTDHGLTFGPNGGTLIATGNQGAYVAVGPDHAVYAFWWTPTGVMMRKSVDQGVSFGAPVTVSTFLATGGTNGDLGLTGTPQGGSLSTIRSSKFPHAAVNPINGNVYAVYADDGAGADKADIYVVQSTNGGATWGAPIKVNDDVTTTDQWQPTLAVSTDGTRLGVFYYSRQEDPANNMFKYYGRIANISGGTINFLPSFAVSDTPSLPEVGRDSAINTTYMGDYDHAVATPGYFHVTWSDSRSDLSGGAPRKDPNVFYEKIPLGLAVISTVPAVGTVIATTPTSFTVNVTDPINAGTLDGSDFVINGIAALSASYTSGTTTIQFDFASTPVTAQGLQNMHIDAGAFTRASDNGPVIQFDGAFRYDATLLSVTSTVPPVSGVFTLPGPFTYDVNFNEPVEGNPLNPGSVQTSDLVLSGIAGAFVSGVTLLPGNTTARFTLSGITTEAVLTASIAAGAITDTFGNPNGAFSASYSTDIGTVAFPTPLTSKPPSGSLIYDPTAAGLISPTADTDSFTLSVDAGQQITVIVRPTTVTTLQPTITLRDPSNAVLGTATAPALNQNAILQTIPTTTAGTYTFTIAGAAGTVGNYTVQVILNAAEELERNAGQPTNNTAGTAQNINPTFLSLGGSASRGAVMGTVASTSDLDFYSLSLTSGDTVTVALAGISSSAVTAQLRDSTGALVLATAIGGPANLSKVLSNFVVTTTGVYNLVIGSTVAGATYDAVVTRNADFDREDNALTTPQSLDGTHAVLGHTGPVAAAKLLAVSGAGNTASTLYELNPATGAVIATIGATGMFHITGIDIHPITGEIYAVTNATDQLVKINPTTGVATVVGSTLSQIPDIAFRSDGTLFAWVETGAGNDDLATINLTTGAVTIIPSTINSFQTGIAFDSADNLYVKTSTLYRVNPATGAIISSVALSTSTRNVLEFGPGDVLYTASRTTSTGPSTLQTINVTTGLVTTLGTTPGVGISGLTFGAGDQSDTYSFSVNAGDSLALLTNTPADGPGEFVNTLNPRLELYNPSGFLVDSGVVLGDGRNESISHTALATGIYKVRVFGEGATKGEYFLSVTGNTGTIQPAFQVTTTVPANGATVNSAATMTVDFNDAYLVSSVQPTDLVIDGSLTPTAITVVDGDTVSFTLPALANGPHTFAIAAGAIVDVQNTPVQAFSGAFTVDSIAPRVTATSIAPNAVLTPGNLTYVITFSEPMNAANITSTGDFTLHGNFRQAAGVNYTPSTFAFSAGNTVLTLNYTALPDDNYTLTLLSASTSFTDAAGNLFDGEFTGVFPSGNGTAGGNFVIGFNMDPGTLAFPTPVSATPLGGLIYSASTNGTIAFTGDTDSFTMAIDAGQTVTVLVTPTTTSPNTLQPTVSLFSPSSTLLGSAIAPASLQRALLQTIPAATSGIYTVTVGGVGTSVGLYTVQLILNTALEGESNNGPTNNTAATAQDLSPAINSAFLSLGGSASRAAVSGSVSTVSPDAGQDWYKFTLAIGDTLTVALNTSTPNAQLRAPDGVTILATAVTGPTNVSRVITDFTATVAGTYYLVVTSTSTIAYNAVLTKNSEFDTESNNSTTLAQNVLSRQDAGEQWALGNITSADLDLYKITLGAGVTLSAQTSTPAGGPNQFVNNLNPRLRVLNSVGAQVALDDNSAGDGKNALVSFINSGAADVFYVEVSSTTATSTIGEYVLRIAGNTVTAPPFAVTTTTPLNAALLLTSPTTMVVNFNDVYLATSVQASDLQVDGVNATGVTQTDGDTLTFTLVGGYGNGTHTVTMTAGSILDVQNTALTAYAGTFTVDTIAPRVTATSVAPGATLTAGSLSYQVTFSEPMRTANILTTGDFNLNGNFRGASYTPTTLSFNPAGTVLTINYTGLPDDSYTLTLIAGVTGGTNFTDVAGNALDGEFSGTFPSGNGVAGGNFVIGFNMDIATEAFPALTPKLPLGSLIYDPSMVRTLAFAGDSDTFTVAVDPGQTISVLIIPTTAALQPTVELRDPSNTVVATATASAAGQRVYLNPVGATVAGVCTITVTGAASTTGLYTAQVTLNAALEAEGNGGSGNDTRATAQDIDASFITLQTTNVSATRGAVLGGNASASDFYSFTLGAGGTTTLALKALTAGAVNVELQDGTGTVLAVGSAGATNLDKVISNFFVATAGTYYARVSGASATYSLVVTRNAAFDTEGNDTFGTAQNISGTPAVLGAITPASAGGGTVVPGSLATVEGNSGNAFPFHIATFAPNMRYQQIYAANQFATGGVIDTIRFRRDSGQPTFGSTTLDVKINLSYAATTVDTPSTTFASNVGLGLVTVFDGLMTISSTGSGAPNPFDIVLDVANTFNYNPANGSLLVDVFMRNSPSTVFIDAATGVAGVRRIFSYPNDINSSTGTVDSGAYGLVTRFDFQATAANEDWYSINVASTANLLRLESSTPADGPNEFVNNLNPKIELYDPSNILVASGTVLGDGRNEFLEYQPLTTGNYRVRISSEGVSSGEYFLTANFSPAPTVAVTTPIDENGFATVSGAVGDPDSLDSHIVVITWGPGEGSTTLTLGPGVATFSASHQYMDDDPTSSVSDVYPISVTVTDNHGATGGASTSVTVDNVAPVVTSLNPASSLDENGVYSLTGVFHDDGTLDTHTVVITWGAGEGSTTLANTDLIDLGGGDWGFSASHQYFDDNPTATTSDVYTISVSVTDDDTSVGILDTSLTVNNVAPVVGIIVGPSPSPGVRGQMLSFSAAFTDIGTLDTHTAVWNWGDTTSSSGAVTESSGSGIVAGSHLYTEAGTYTVTLTVTDDDTGATPVTKLITIEIVAIQTDACDSTKTQLVVGGSTSNDTIVFTPDTGDAMQVILNGMFLGSFTPTGRIVAFGQAGDDNIQVAGFIERPTWFYGDAGNDRLKGGAGAGVLLGGAGDDQLVGGKGPNLLIGGLGVDRLIGASGSDLLIGGYTNFDVNEGALCAIMDEWTSPRDYDTKLANLRGLGAGPRCNGDNFLTSTGPSPSVFDDGAIDTLTGSSSIDWFFLNYGDVITDLHDDEEIG